jgi:hypothetical protein
MPLPGRRSGFGDCVFRPRVFGIYPDHNHNHGLKVSGLLYQLRVQTNQGDVGNLGQLFNAKGLEFHQNLVERYGGMVKVHGFFGVKAIKWKAV